MKHRTALVAASAVAAVALGLAGCTAASDGDRLVVESAAANVAVDADLAPEAVLAANADATTVNADEWSADEAVDIALEGATASSAADGVTIEGGTVTITAAGVYRLRGELDGQVVVAAPEEALVVLILDGATISSSTTAAIAATSADDLAIFLAEGTVNTLSDAAAYPDDADADAALFSDVDLTIDGTGSLVVEGNGNDGIVSHDDLVILSGEITVTAADDAVRGKDALVIEGGVLDLTAGGDGLKSDEEEDATAGYVAILGGEVTVATGDDGIQATSDIVLLDGSVTVSAGAVASEGEQSSKGLTAGAVVAVGGGVLAIVESYEGIEGFAISIAGGELDIVSSDDGLNASTGGQTSTADEDTAAGGMGGGDMADGGEEILISGGTLTIDADGDGIDSNGSVTIAGGTVTVWGPTANGNGALDSNGSFTVSGGVLIAAGSAGMAETPDASSPQGWVAATVSGSAGASVEVRDAAGTTIASFTAGKPFATLIVSDAGIASGASLTIVVDGEATTATAGSAIGGGMGGGFPGGGGPGAPR